MKQNAAKLEMSAREDDGERILEGALKNAKDKKKTQEAYEIETLLVEMLIYKVWNFSFPIYMNDIDWAL